MEKILNGFTEKERVEASKIARFRMFKWSLYDDYDKSRVLSQAKTISINTFIYMSFIALIRDDWTQERIKWNPEWNKNSVFSFIRRSKITLVSTVPILIYFPKVFEHYGYLGAKYFHLEKKMMPEISE